MSDQSNTCIVPHHFLTYSIVFNCWELPSHYLFCTQLTQFTDEN